MGPRAHPDVLEKSLLALSGYEPHNHPAHSLAYHRAMLTSAQLNHTSVVLYIILIDQPYCVTSNILIGAHV